MPKIEKICILYIYRKYLLYQQSNASGSFLQKCINFVEQRLRVLLSFCLFFCQFQPGVACKSVAYKKKSCIFQKLNVLKNDSFSK